MQINASPEGYFPIKYFHADGSAFAFFFGRFIANQNSPPLLERGGGVPSVRQSFD